MQRQHAFWSDKIDIAQEIVVIRVVGERESGIDLIAIDRTGIDGPAADQGNAFACDLFQHLRPVRTGRADQDLAGDIV